MQTIYHGSYCKVDMPKIINSKYTKDFGEGFYCTLIDKQAIKWAKKFTTPFVNSYEYTENRELNIKKFDNMTEEWLDFIIASRNGKKHNYDIVSGPMADDQIYNFITDLMDGTITRSAFWELAKFRYPTHQIVFCTKEALECIKFIDCKEV